MENVSKLTSLELNSTIRSNSLATVIKPVVIADDIAIEIKVKGSRKIYDGFVSLSEKILEIEAKLLQLSALILPNSEGTPEDTTEAIDTLPEIINFLTEYKNTETLKNTSNLSTEDISENVYRDVFN